MNYSTLTFLFAVLAIAPLSLQAQEVQPLPFDYVMIEIRMTNRVNKPMRIGVDFGQTNVQREQSLRFTRELSELQTRGAILNYMAERGFELDQAMVESRASVSSSDPPVFYFIMKRAKSHSDD